LWKAKVTLLARTKNCVGVREGLEGVEAEGVGLDVGDRGFEDEPEG
jgi:hypothetical protein